MLSAMCIIGPQSTMKLYRAMQVSPNEVLRLRACREGAILSMNSFVSTSRKVAVAMMYLGSVPERDVLFEILIDRNLLDSNSTPFADISAMSNFSEEEEVLLSMGTILQVESVTSVTKTKIVYVHARLCYEEDADVKELRTFIMKQFPRGRDACYYIERLADLCAETGDKERVNQLMRLERPYSQNAPRRVYGVYSRLTDVFQYSNQLGDALPHMVKGLTDMLRLIQNCGGDPHTPNYLRHAFSSLQQCLTAITSTLNSETFMEEPERIHETLALLLSSFEQAMPSLSVPRSHPIFVQLKMARGMYASHQGRHEEALSILDECLTSSTASLLNNNHMLQQNALITIAESAVALGAEERYREIIGYVLSSAEPHPQTLQQLGLHYKSHDDLPMAIACYRAVIDDCKLPSSSSFVIEAYSSIGSAFDKIGNNGLAFQNLSIAWDLLLQHHSPSHSLVPLVRWSLLTSVLKLQQERLTRMLDRMPEGTQAQSPLYDLDDKQL